MTDHVPEVAKILLEVASGKPLNIYLVRPSDVDRSCARKIILMTIRNPAYESLEVGERTAFIESRLRTCLTGNKTVSAWAGQVLNMQDGLARLAGYFTQAY